MHAWYPGPMAPVVAMIRGGMVMGIQKHRRSKMSGATRRAHWKLRGATLANCPKCPSPKRPHRVCPTCGTYAVRDVMKIEAAVDIYNQWKRLKAKELARDAVMRWSAAGS